MEEFYKQERARQERNSRVTGIILVTVLHLGLVVFGLTSGLKYLYPPPPEQVMLIDFSESTPERPVQQKDGNQPVAVNADPEKDLKLVQKAEGQMEGTQANEAPEATVGTDGDVEVPEPPRTKEINRKALFQAPDNKTEKDTLAPHAAEKVSDELRAGHAEGNTRTGEKKGMPNAKVKGRSTVGQIPKPSYPVQEDGIVVVDIIVDQYGKVISAIPGGKGTTASDQSLWEVARKAALSTYFNTDLNAPRAQSGTITYRFDLVK